MTDGKTKDDVMENGSAPWRAEDFTWDGLKAKGWQGWVVGADGFVREAESGAVYGAAAAAASDDAANGGEGGAAPKQSRPASLQDFWRADPADGRWRDDAAMIAAGELTFKAQATFAPPGAAAPPPPTVASEYSGDGTAAPSHPPETYHIAHLPIAYADGTPTGKADWPTGALDALIGARLAASGETKWEGEWYDRKVIGPDRRARLDGGMWPEFDAARACGGERLAISVSFNAAFFWGTCQFQQAAFSGDADFMGAAFSGDAHFERAAFSGDAYFSSAAFSASAHFQGVAFSGAAYFSSAAFSASAHFHGAAFSSDANFEVATFSGAVYFISAAFSNDGNFGGAAFSGGTHFDSAAFSGAAYFNSAAFFGHATFRSADFFGDATFDSAAFSGAADFERAAFSGDAEFMGATFSGAADFESSAFSGDAYFSSAAFSGAAHFERAAFCGAAYFSSAAFKKRPSFNDASFRGIMGFEGAVFEDQASFKDIAWVAGENEDHEPWSQAEAHWRRAFYTAEFKGPVDFEGAGARAFAAFDGARLERGITFDKPKASDIDRAFRRELNFVVNFPAPDAATRKNLWRKLFPSRDEIADQQVGLAALEGGCRVLKQAMAASSDSLREQQFYRFEVIARRKQRATPWSEKLFSYFYGWTANYGASIGWPIVWIFILVALFGSAYWLGKVGPGHAGAALAAMPAGLPQGAIDPPFLKALEFSFSRVFPFGAFEDVSKQWIAEFEDQDTLWTLAIRILASVQSALALALVFVFGLAVRRKFQIE